ncbi:hypothetical protein ANANG_G00046980 [Anguilla anguilla]|uniref:Uncharacterized protein n=1 Tax=Anguilla anguilla TaxID=7936 RepID=A0A9D3S544_ANGAN|nr:hypothetical protein ANANG_G00046980 [Anguilla anguilla]
MDLIGNLTGSKGKGSGNNMVDKVIDTAAVKAKEQIGSMMGGKKQAGEPAAKGGIGDMVSGAVGNIAADAAKDSVMDEVTKFGGSVQVTTPSLPPSLIKTHDNMSGPPPPPPRPLTHVWSLKELHARNECYAV